MRVWIDIDNSPHVPFFAPVITQLRSEGNSVLVTAREYAQTRQMLDNAGIKYVSVSSHAGAGTLKKVANLAGRSVALARLVRSFKPDVAASHGSRALSLTAKAMGIPSVVFFDYEWTEMHIFKRCADMLVCPAVLSDGILTQAGLPLKKISRYNGFKEELYLPDFIPDPTFRESLGIPHHSPMITIRPSSMTSNYHDRRSEDILAALVRRFKHEPDARGIVTPRTRTDRDFVQHIIESEQLTNVRIMDEALPGLQLLYWSDVVVSGGGTMNREAALLGTPTVSMFTGRRPAIDDYLSREGKLRFVEQPVDIETVPFRRQLRRGAYRYPATTVRRDIVDVIYRCARRTAPSAHVAPQQSTPLIPTQKNTLSIDT